MHTRSKVPEVAQIAARMRQHHDAAEAERLGQERRIQAERDFNIAETSSRSKK